MSETGSYTPTILSSTGENMEDHYNAKRINISYENKVILDLGASNGDAAEYFIYMGAKYVIAIEGQLLYFAREIFKELIENSQKFSGKIVPIFLYIENSKQIEDLILAYKPNVVKCDIEGTEKYLFEIKDEIWRLVPEYLVETHEGVFHNDLDKIMYAKCKKTKYKILFEGISIAHIIYAKREE